MAIEYLEKKCVKFVFVKEKEPTCIPVLVPFLQFLPIGTNIMGRFSITRKVVALHVGTRSNNSQAPKPKKS